MREWDLLGREKLLRRRCKRCPRRFNPCVNFQVILEIIRYDGAQILEFFTNRIRPPSTCKSLVSASSYDPLGLGMNMASVVDGLPFLPT